MADAYRASPLVVSFVGSGNVATHLATALSTLDGVRIGQIYSRHRPHAQALAERVKADHTDDLSEIRSDTAVVFVSVTDDALPHIARELRLSARSLVCHTAGSVSSQVFRQVGTDYGVLYPLQTFSKDRPVSWREVPILVTGSNKTASSQLHGLAQRLSNRVVTVSDEQRFAIHLAAVFSCNFSNAMLQVGHEICAQHELDPGLLQPLIQETWSKLEHLTPAEAQTGPARRGDIHVLRRHLDILSASARHAQIYRLVSQYLLDRHHGVGYADLFPSDDGRADQSDDQTHREDLGKGDSRLE